ncbi:MAG TPA: ABC transporter ATP-binding protein [Symbiobacteriaceae bacterium]|nr:ABC transporter ATP-binding protein [Symbiobacteriaceae bacterium]
MERVEVLALTKSYGKAKALSDVSLTFPEGSLTAVLGPSGCGKTTLMRSIAGFIQPEAGEIRFGGQNVTRLQPQERGTAMVFQSYALWPHMTVYDNIAYGLKLKRIPETEVRRRVQEVLELVEISGVTGVERRKPPELSGGQQQRVALARALVVQPRVLLLDEPLSNLDAKVRQRLRVEIRRLQKAVGTTAIYVTHDQEEALAIADHVVIMNKGQVEQAGTPEEVYRRPANLFVADFMGITNVLRGQAAESLGATAGGTAVFRANEARILHATDAVPPEHVVLAGQVEEVTYLGTAYRHYIRIGAELVMVDADRAMAEPQVRLALPRTAIQIFAA